MAHDEQRSHHGPGSARQVRPRHRQPMRGALMSGVAAVAASALAAACATSTGATGSASGGGQHKAAAAATVIAARRLQGVGMVLVDAAGMTVYSPQQEAKGKIHCVGSCLSFWFPVTVSSADVARHASGVSGVLGTVRRPDDGKLQLTYDGRPLYTFRLDTAPGQDHGNNYHDNFGGTSFTWHAVTTAGGAAPSSGPAGASPASSAYPGSGSGY
jgi:predicted lipoprotein with Yx(FWY)xxD motif